MRETDWWMVIFLILHKYIILLILRIILFENVHQGLNIVQWIVEAQLVVSEVQIMV